MRELKEFEEFLKKGIVKKQTPDEARAKDLNEEAERKFGSLNMILDKIGLSDENANDIIEICYDIVSYLIRAKMLLRGYSSSGAGAHEAEVAYLKTLNFSEEDVRFVNQLRYFRNGIMYYGKRFDKEYAEKVIDFMKKVRERLK
ncbi:hypothetical protein CMI46_02145 [Candidatus Pacearchaeota archaeon]|nr:hypothetical protein [Candidatus Pacearchaeota archaeon]|tara:strand:+ start:5380 stop:5811 length:432 start_codon:yes stop_codon:yes gene_type:complete